jgi:hypothetical protein
MRISVANQVRVSLSDRAHFRRPCIVCKDFLPRLRRRLL